MVAFSSGVHTIGRGDLGALALPGAAGIALPTGMLLTDAVNSYLDKNLSGDSLPVTTAAKVDRGTAGAAAAVLNGQCLVSAPDTNQADFLNT